MSRFEAQGLLTTKPGLNRSKLVNIAEYDRAAGETGDAIRTMNGTGAAPSPAANVADPLGLVLAHEQAKRMSYQAEIARLDLGERIGELIPVADVEAAFSKIFGSLVSGIDQLPGAADEIASAVGRDGAQGARGVLKQQAMNLRARLSREMERLRNEGVSATAAEGEGADSGE